MRTKVMTAVLALAIVSCVPGWAWGAEYTMKLALPSAEDAANAWAKRIKTAVERGTAGRVQVDIFPRGQLGTQPASIQGLQLGTIEAFIAPADFYQGIDARMGVLSFPFLFKDRKHANRVLKEPAVYTKLAGLLDSKGIIGCGVVSTADVRYMARQPIRKLSDFNGKKMRINGTDAERERFRRLGATAVAMNLADMLTALDNKTVDGTGSGLSIFVNFKLESVSTELLRVEDTLVNEYCGMSKRWLDGLPPDLREIVIRETRSPALFDDVAKDADGLIDGLTKRWDERGGKINQLSDADQVEIRAKLADVGTVVSEGKPELRALYVELKAVADKTP